MSEAERDGRSTRWDPHRRERRAMIIAAAIAAIEEAGPDAVTAQIAQRAGVPRTHVYRHFEDKPSLDLAVCRHAAGEFGASIRAGLVGRTTPRQLITGAIASHLTWVEAHPNLYRFLIRNSYAVQHTGELIADDAKAALAVELSRLLGRYLELFQVDSSQAERLIVGIVGMVDATTMWWLERRDVSSAQLTADLSDNVWLCIARLIGELGLTVGPDDELPPLARPAHG